MESVSYSENAKDNTRVGFEVICNRAEAQTPPWTMAELGSHLQWTQEGKEMATGTWQIPLPSF